MLAFGMTLATLLFLGVAALFMLSLLAWWSPAPSPPNQFVAVLPTQTSLPQAARPFTPTPAPVGATATPLVPTQPALESPTETAVLSTPSPSPTPTVSPEEAPLGQLLIPSIDLAEPVTAVFVKDGQWDISQLGNQVGHLQTTGRFPGDDYAMTLTGHVTVPWPEIAGPFAELVFVEHGDEIIYRWQGTDYVYEVERIFRLSPQAIDMLYEPDGNKLLLVTCSGWNFTDRQYDERLLTRAVLVRTEPTSPTLQQ